MPRLVVSRLGRAGLLLLLVSAVVFALLRLAPGEPGASLYGPGASVEDLARIRERWGLDSPIHVQYLRWLANAARGDLGHSYADGRPVLGVITARVPATLLLTGSALALAALFGTAAGVLSAARRFSWPDRFITLIATLLYSTPAFWLGLMSILVFSIRLGWLPSGGLRTPGEAPAAGDILAHLALPALVLASRDAGRLARLTRASMLETAAQDYVRAARAKGLTESRIALVHAWRNALLPSITMLGMAVPGLLSGSVVVETVFGWPGLGRLALESALQRNYPVVLGEVLIVAALALLGSLLADLACMVADPRLRSVRGG